MPLIRRSEMCRWDWRGGVLPESRSDRSGEHDCLRGNQIMGDAVIRIFNGKAQVVVDCFLRECLDSPIWRVNECDILEQWMGFLNCLQECGRVCDFFCSFFAAFIGGHQCARCVLEYNLGPVDCSGEDCLFILEIEAFNDEGRCVSDVLFFRLL